MKYWEFYIFVVFGLLSYFFIGTVGFVLLYSGEPSGCIAFYAVLVLVPEKIITYHRDLKRFVKLFSPLYCDFYHFYILVF